ncbi:AAA family ATPase [Kribbella catacumbae]|uniref:AAA family ATPase n=1 Tax=Kribbella catacumbae TaxID=460086 RepID=UPI000A05768E|nr:AAA family ATPase [Kribbella catacumbae]
MRKLTLIQTRGLLGEFNHRIPFPADWTFVIMYGQNGVGKTRLLESVRSLITLQLYRLWSAPFASLSLQFDDGSRLSVFRGDHNEQTLWSESYSDNPSVEEPADLTFSLTLEGQMVSTCTIPFDKEGEVRFASWLDRHTTWYQVGDDLWEDTSDGEVVSYGSLRNRYQAIAQGTARRNEIEEVSDDIRRFCDELKCHLIETQRLLTRSKYQQPSPSRSVSSRPSTTSTVTEYSQDLEVRLNQALATNSRITQQLDRSFPRRILIQPSVPGIDESEIRARYVAQNDRRTRLAALGLIEAQADFPLPDQEIEGWQQGVLRTYLDDTDKKLASFDDVLNKITLLEEIVNSRFLRKKISVNAQSGLTIRSERSGRTLSPQALSSGEQHELILIYDLLFNVPPGSIVMIDEPEISLHVVWQQRFLQDLTKVAKVASLRFVIATHSPQIIHKSWNQTVELDAELEQS